MIDDTLAGFYNDHPYPAHGVVSTVVALMLEDAVSQAEARLGRRQLRILDVGCGTGEQTIGIKKRFPECEVLGCDLSVASIKYAKELAVRRGFDVGFFVGDLLALPLASGSFDIIVCVGVLHHLDDPRSGFSSLVRCVRSSGVLLGMVYGEFGRWETLCTRSAVERLCGDLPLAEQLAVMGSASLAGNVGLRHYLRQWIRRRRFGPRIPLTEALLRVARGRSSAYQLDSYLHPRDISFTWEQLASLLDQTGWLFEGWPVKSGMPDTPKQLFGKQALSLAQSLTLLERAAVFERIVRPELLYFLASPASPGSSCPSLK